MGWDAYIYMLLTGFRYLNSHIRQRNKTHGRADDEGRLNPWIVLFESLNVVHVVDWSSGLPLWRDWSTTVKLSRLLLYDTVLTNAACVASGYVFSMTNVVAGKVITSGASCMKFVHLLGCWSECSEG
jgi:hypothetical protein